ncbi:MAG: patatin-like phospholipase family protein [Cyclobacteriaceae bacterium]|jgi:NTE family protein|nr:patatin-like phospholipase family protein [Cyclobacteriaceae bacterium]
MRILIACLLLLVYSLSSAQKVALVFSGGGAKGIAHVGVLKALEENEIPVDYIVGTSMGGIVAGCYASGMSPDAIEAMLLSEDFLRWVTGLPEKGYNFHYYSDSDTPGVLRVNFSLDSANVFQFNQSLANDASLNFALTEKVSMASAISRNNFDSLMVPLRILAADIFTQTQVVISKGSLSEAMRVTQTVPFFYSPIRIDGRYLFDGGIYNNFPVNVALEVFNPDVVIGSNVSSKVFSDYPYGEDDKLINRSLLYMLLDKSDPSTIPESGVYIQSNLEGYSAMDFTRVKALIDSGYAQTIRKMPEIKSKVAARVTCEEIAAKRNRFSGNSVPFIFDGVVFKGFRSSQQEYIRRLFPAPSRRADYVSIADIKLGYFNLIGEPFFNNVFPTILFNPEQNRFSLQLVRRPQRNFPVDIGGMMASRNISNLYVGLNYYYFRKALTHAYLGITTGSFYKSLTGNARIDYSRLGRFYIQPGFTYNEWDYIESTDLLQKSTPTVLKRFDRKLTMNVGKPLGRNLRAVISFNAIANTDRYSNDKAFISTDTLDMLKLNGFKTGFSLTSNTLDRKQYASSGRSFYLGAEYFDVNEDYTPGNTAARETVFQEKHTWMKLRMTAEQYFQKGRFRPGYYVDAVFSNQPVFANYTGTIVNAPGFFPLQDSRTLILENFRAFNFIAAGSRNVFILKSRLLQFRLEGYIFKPLQYITQDASQQAITASELGKFYFTGTAGLVYHSPIGPISLSTNYYDDAENRWGVLFHAGFILFNKHSFE